MASTYGYSAPKFGFKPLRPNDRGGPYGPNPAPSPFPSLAAPRPDNRAGALGANPLGAVTQPRVASRPAPAAPPVQQTPAPAPAQPAAPQPGFGYDYSTDPILQKIRALGTQGREDATTNATMLKKQALTDYGAKDMALDPSILGDQNTALAAEQNPYSVFGQLRKQYDTGANALDESLNNDGNLLYSGHRIKQQGQLADQYQGALAGATGELSNILGNIDQGRLAAVLGADQADLQAEQNAAQSAIAAALAGGYSFGGYGPDGKPVFTGGPAASPADALGGALAGDASGSIQSIGQNNPLAVGQTDNPLIHALLGRKTDPRFQF